MSETLTTQQYIDKAKELIEAIIKSLDKTCEAFKLTDDERSKLLNKFMLDMFIPSLKDGYLNSLQFALWGDEPYDRFNRKRTDYSRLSSRSNENTVCKIDAHKNHFDCDDLIFSTWAEADVILNRLISYIHDYKQVTVGYLYDLIGESVPYTAEYYGWTNLDDADIKVDALSGSKYRLCLPRPVRLEEFK